MSEDIDMKVCGQRIEELLQTIHEGIEKNAAQNEQKLLGKALTLLTELRKPQFAHMLAELELAVTSLLSDPSHPDMATQVIDHISHEIKMRNDWRYAWRADSPQKWVLVGSFTLLVLGFGILTLASRYYENFLFENIDKHIYSIVVIYGAVGGAVSLLARLNDFSSGSYKNKSGLFFTGFCKPIVGAAFAIFVVSIIISGLLPISIESMEKGASLFTCSNSTSSIHSLPKSECEMKTQFTFFLIGISFLSGFSERFVKDIMAKTGAGVAQK